MTILTGDFEQTLEYIDGNTFFYFDPPYRPLSNTSSFNDYAKSLLMMLLKYASNTSAIAFQMRRYRLCLAIRIVLGKMGQTVSSMIYIGIMISVEYGHREV